MRKIMLLLMLLWANYAKALGISEAYKIYYGNDESIKSSLILYMRGYAAGFAYGKEMGKDVADVSAYEYCVRGLDFSPILQRIFEKFENGEYKANEALEGWFIVDAVPEMQKCRERIKRPNWQEEEVDLSITSGKL